MRTAYYSKTLNERNLTQRTNERTHKQALDCFVWFVSLLCFKFVLVCVSVLVGWLLCLMCVHAYLFIYVCNIVAEMLSNSKACVFMPIICINELQKVRSSEDWNSCKLSTAATTAAAATITSDINVVVVVAILCYNHSFLCVHFQLSNPQLTIQFIFLNRKIVHEK